MKYKFCPHCGEQLQEKVPMPTKKIGETDEKIMYTTTYVQILKSKKELDIAKEKFKKRYIY